MIWNKKKDGPGFTCCQNALLSNPASENNSRIDLILTHGKVKAKGGRTTNDTPFRQAPPPLWESDHAGVVTKLKVYAGPEHPHAAQQPQPYQITQIAQ